MDSQGKSGTDSRWRFCVAPMMDWTDRHCRYFHRQLTARARLYTEMVTTGALLQGDPRRHLAFEAEEQPVALQIGGSEPDELARAARLGERWGYDEINLNCGCPSERVRRGAFGACLMTEPRLVVDGVKAMLDVVDIPVTVKHRVGVDQQEDYGFVRDFVGALAEAGCRVFIVHARSAWLKGLSPKENRQVPPLRYEVVRRLKADFPALVFVLNGGLSSLDAVQDELAHVDGVMLGRAAYHDPWLLADVDRRFFAEEGPVASREEVVERMAAYLRRETARGTAPRHIVRHMLGLYHGVRGARQWRRELSDATELERDAAEVLTRVAQWVAPPTALRAA
ncbi:MAG TPA: tRNA dihydrouridine(20/20a) synthase DusA [Burkholderiaceae bacterium]|nr:tRNA dihydrouridine(20/20a) synthase DusA [Burkholderiaceae bacterium]